jgi:hypothetical protein
VDLLGLGLLIGSAHEAGYAAHENTPVVKSGMPLISDPRI